MCRTVWDLVVQSACSLRKSFVLRCYCLLFSESLAGCQITCTVRLGIVNTFLYTYGMTTTGVLLYKVCDCVILSFSQHPIWKVKLQVDTKYMWIRKTDSEANLGENVSVAKCSPIFTVYSDSTVHVLLMLQRLTWMQTDAIFGTLKALPVHPHRLPPLCRGSYIAHSPAGRRQTSLCLSQRYSPFPTCTCFA